MDRQNTDNVVTSISQAKLDEWLDSVQANFPLFAPRREFDNIYYRHIDSIDQIVWDYDRPLMSIKEILFPPTETLFTFRKKGGEVFITESETTVKEKGGVQVVWGVRSCDARGIQVLDTMFLDDPVDPYYAHRREKTILVGLACKEKGPTCFCDLTGGAPDAADGLDVQVHESEDFYTFHAVTKKGYEFLLSTGINVALPQPEKYNPRRDEWINLPNFPPKEQLPLIMQDPYWDDVAERCLSCRICAYVCPTCRCFDVRDEVITTTGSPPGSFERIRCWDSCAGENYRRIAGGHRPRAENGERLRNRFLCKFYYFPEQYGLDAQIACTGCGRCIEACPVNIDITEVMGELQSRF